MAALAFSASGFDAPPIKGGASLSTPCLLLTAWRAEPLGKSDVSREVEQIEFYSPVGYLYLLCGKLQR
jgi:hypothetical protein